jgi:hypothetical protein
MSLSFLRLACAVGVIGLLCPARSDAAAPAGRYSASGGTVLDQKTGLTWQQSTSTTTYSFADATTYCSGNTPALPGGGWRLPSMKELLSIVDDRAATAPTIDTTYFLSAQAGWYWTSTLSALMASNAWIVTFGNGGVFSKDITLAVDTSFVRCVR